MQSELKTGNLILVITNILIGIHLNSQMRQQKYGNLSRKTSTEIWKSITAFRFTLCHNFVSQFGKSEFGKI